MSFGLLDGLLDRTIVLAFDRSGFARHARRCHARDLAIDLSGRVCLVTGANSGIGLATATALAARAAQVWLLCRDRSARKGFRRGTVGPRMSHAATIDERFAERWGRRVVTIPLYLCLGILTAALLPVCVSLALAIDAARRTGHLATVRCVLALTLYFACEALGLVASLLVWIASGVWAGGNRERFVAWNLVLQHIWAGALFGGATRLFGMRTEVAGREAVSRGPLFLFSRHASTLDTLLPAVFASHPRTLRLRWVMKRELLWDPCLDVVGQRTCNAFIRRVSGAPDKEIAIVRQLATDLGNRDGILIFPEGTRFSPAKRDRALARLSESGQRGRCERLRLLHHVLPPHLGGVMALLEARPDVDVAFLAHVGFEGTASLSDIWNGKLVGRTIHLRFWRVPSAAIPHTPDARVEWLDGQWARIDAWIDPCACARPATRK